MTKVTMQCGNCGGDQFELPSPLTDNSIIRCASCGAPGRYGDVRKEALRQTEAAVQKVFKDAFKKFK